MYRWSYGSGDCVRKYRMMVFCLRTSGASLKTVRLVVSAAWAARKELELRGVNLL